MTDQSQELDQLGRADPAGASSGPGRSADASTGYPVDIGYESADPSLQASMWQDAADALPSRWERR